MSFETFGQPLLTFPDAEKSPLSIRAKALVFVDPRSRQLREELEHLAPRAISVLIRGETATPVAFTLALTVPTVTADWLQAYARGLNRMAQSCGIALVGGDTTRGPLSLTVTVFGRIPAGQALTRSGARAGDLLCVGGELGNAAGALPLVLGQQGRIAARQGQLKTEVAEAEVGTRARLPVQRGIGRQLEPAFGAMELAAAGRKHVEQVQPHQLRNLRQP